MMGWKGERSYTSEALLTVIALVSVKKKKKRAQFYNRLKENHHVFQWKITAFMLGAKLLVSD